MPAAADTPTGLTPTDLTRLSTVEKTALRDWMASVASAGKGPRWWPAAIRRLPLADRLRQAFDPHLDAAWKERERRRVARDPGYFTASYGHLQPPTGPPIPFAMWAEQGEVMVAFRTRRKVIVLKARQLGLTWLALHYAYWLQAFNPHTPNARILGLSKHGGDASKLLERTRRIQQLLPPYLQHREDPETRGSKSEFALEGRGKMISLAGTPDAARMETATLVLLDEFGFIRNGQAGDTLTAVESTAGETGQEIILSTGNGHTGDGQAFAEEWGKARRGESERHPIFLKASTDPVRTEEWRERKRGNYRTPEDFEAEHPETEEQALGGEGLVRIYPAAHLAAAVQIGRALAALDGGAWLELLAASEGFEIWIDWGDFQTFATYAVPLPNGGIYVVDELVLGHIEPQEASEAILDHRPNNTPTPRFTASHADLSPPGTNRTYAKALAKARAAQPARYPDTHVKVPFGVYKEGGNLGRRRGVNTVGYLRYLARRAAVFVDREGWQDRLEEAANLMAIHPRCKTLVKQMENLERDPKTGKVRKPDMDPRRPELGDHGPDSLVAGAFHRAKMWNAAHTDQQEE